MPDERELDLSAAQLADVKQHHNAIGEILEDYGRLLRDHKRLLSDLEEERNRREFYKQQTKGQDRDPYVLVLIDGDGYIFADDLISKYVDGQRKCTEEGGLKAADLLDNAIRNDLRRRSLDRCRVEVLVYANVAGLSKALARQGLAGQHSRSLAAFATGFTRGRSHFDYVDAGELKEGADFKIKAKFESAIASVQCKHVYFAGCHDVGYINLLQQYCGRSDENSRITLLKGPSFHPGFSTLGLAVQEPYGDFRNLFRTAPIDFNHTNPINTRNGLQTPPIITPTTPTFQDAPSSPVCKFYLQGRCSYGKDCKNVHPLKSLPNRHIPPTTTVRPRQDIESQQEKAARLLPRQAPESGLIPLNCHDCRLDLYHPTPTSEQLKTWKEHTSKIKVCNNYHLGLGCEINECHYNHQPLSPDQIETLRIMNRNSPCKQQGACRKKDCPKGHICQKDCRGSAIPGMCKLPGRAHHTEFSVAQWVPAEAAPHSTPVFDDISESGDQDEDDEDEDSASAAGAQLLPDLD
ncbi:hypothetical protein EV356DRAFT_452845 [Viridothelium virens]|uniref:C3H1-type domain-containing protein n=1 Tax=Viridothelium virens TaxID=1048519 RepID=A0A6A6GZD7_VIRVR|nr:hypothetical protein EV356DRAFT_452845 [Viridothelium virens]